MKLLHSIITLMALITLRCPAMQESLSSSQKKAIIIGASSGMGREVAKLLSKEGYVVGLVARRLPLLESLQKEIGSKSFIKQIDVTDSDAREKLQELITEMNGLDLIVISITAYLDNKNSKEMGWEKKERTLDVDAKGFIAMADVAFTFFEKQNHGHLVGISSTSGLRGSTYNPVYSAAKACISCYMEGMRNYMLQNNIDVQVTDIVAGFVAVEHSLMGEDPSVYWEITTEQAGKTIVEGIKNQQKIVYVPSKVWIIACLLQYLPDWAYNNYLPWL